MGSPYKNPQRRGLLAAGNWLVDHVKTIDAWPAQDGLALVSENRRANGGGPYNVLKDLSLLGAPFPLFGLGRLGKDDDAAFIREDCRHHNIDTTSLLATRSCATSYSDVMTDAATGRRTFFHHCGANARLRPADFDFSKTRARHFHLAYLMLLAGLDAPDVSGKARATAVFKKARRAGLTTSLDCVSSRDPSFGATAGSVLPEVDVLFVNDFEAEQITGLSLGRAERLKPAKVWSAVERLLAVGVRRWVVLHFPEGVVAGSSEGQRLWQPAVAVPQDLIAGTSGAGDALAAGILWGVHESWPMETSLRLGVSAAAACLLDATSSGGLRPKNACLTLAKRFGFQTSRF